MNNKVEFIALFVGLMLSSVGLFMAGLSMLQVTIGKGILWGFVVSSGFSAIIYLILAIKFYIK